MFVYFVAACRRCKEYARCRPGRQGNLCPTAPTISGPGELLSVDFVGKLPMSKDYQYFLSAQDVFTKYLFHAPLRDKTAEHVTDALMRIFLSPGLFFKTRVSGFENAKPGFGFGFEISCVNESAYCLRMRVPQVGPPV